MKVLDSHFASEKLNQFKSDFQVEIVPDWGKGDRKSSGNWQTGSWARDELDVLYDTICLFAEIMGGNGKLIQQLGGITVQKTDIGSHGGEAYAHQVRFSKNGPVSPWTIVHECAHAWDANYGWKLSRELERYTYGFTSLFLSRLKKRLGFWDAGPNGKENAPGRQGRRPGCNHAGYFYGDKPSGSSWLFDRREDFAEAVAMYVGWERGNTLSDHARKRIVRYANFKNGEKDDFGVVDNWEDYARYFYPAGGDYTKTRRWKFVDELIQGKIIFK